MLEIEVEICAVKTSGLQIPIRNLNLFEAFMAVNLRFLGGFFAKSGILNMKSGILNIGGGFGGAFSTFKKFLNVEDIYLASMG